MIRAETKLKFAPTVNAAKIQAKRDFMAYCIITGMSPEHRPTARMFALDGAHAFPASTFPELARCVTNILPIIHYRHSWRSGYPKNDGVGCLDLMDSTMLGSDRNPIERIAWLVEHTHAEFRPQVFERLKLLITEGSKISKGVLSRRDEALSILDGAEE
jgi:hypothetical protein